MKKLHIIYYLSLICCFLIQTSWALNYKNRRTVWDKLRETEKISVIEEIGEFTEGYARVYKKYPSNELIFKGYINKSGKSFTARDIDWLEGKNFSEGLAAVKVKYSGWGYLDKDGFWAINPQYEMAGDFYNGLAKVRISTRYGMENGYINKDGKFFNRSDIKFDKKGNWRYTGGFLSSMSKLAVSILVSLASFILSQNFSKKSLPITSQSLINLFSFFIALLVGIFVFQSNIWTQIYETIGNTFIKFFITLLSIITISISVWLGYKKITAYIGK